MTTTPTATAWIDEAGEKGLVRNLQEHRDHEVAIVTGVLVPDAHEDYYRSLLQAPFDRFKQAAPPGEKLHITDALASKNGAWRNAAYQTRDEIREAMLSCGAIIVYGARRLREVRKSHALVAQQSAMTLAQARACRPELDFKSRLSDDRVEIQAFDHLILFLDCFGKDNDVRLRVRSDNLVSAVADACDAALEDARTVTSKHVESSVFNKLSQQREMRRYEVQMSAGGWTADDLNVTHVMPTVEVHKDVGPELLAVDIVANDLLRHFKQSVSPEGAVYGAEATKGWWGAPLLFGSNRNDMPVLELI